MDLDGVFHFMRGKRLAVISTVHAGGHPEAALIGYAFEPRLGLVFDTLSTSRKARNLRARPAAAVVIGWDDEITVQMEGVAREPYGDALCRAKEVYFSAWPEGRGRETWPDVSYFALTPTWIRFSRYSVPPVVVEFNELGGPE